jgi:hypothetical protein
LPQVRSGRASAVVNGGFGGGGFGGGEATPRGFGFRVRASAGGADAEKEDWEMLFANLKPLVPELPRYKVRVRAHHPCLRSWALLQRQKTKPEDFVISTCRTSGVGGVLPFRCTTNAKPQAQKTGSRVLT